MNKRIKDLAEQAGWGKHHSQFDTRIEKFTELLLKECIGHFEDAMVNQEDDVDYGLAEAITIIKTYYGVKV